METKNPNNPKKAAAIIIINLKMLIAVTKDWLTSVKAAMLEIAMTTIMEGLVTPALIAASPIINPHYADRAAHRARQA